MIVTEQAAFLDGRDSPDRDVPASTRCSTPSPTTRRPRR